MTISELQKDLKKFKKEHGDLNIYILDANGVTVPVRVSKKTRPFGTPYNGFFEDYAELGE